MAGLSLSTEPDYRRSSNEGRRVRLPATAGGYETPTMPPGLRCPGHARWEGRRIGRTKVGHKMSKFV